MVPRMRTLTSAEIADLSNRCSERNVDEARYMVIHLYNFDSLDGAPIGLGLSHVNRGDVVEYSSAGGLKYFATIYE